MLGPRAVLCPAMCPGEPGAVCVHHSVLFSFKNCLKIRDCTAYPIQKKIRAPLPVQMPLVQQQPGRALFAVGSGAGAGRARLGSALVALLMARCFHVCRWLRASGVHSGPWWLSFPQPWMVSSSEVLRYGWRFGICCLFVVFGARSSVWVTLLQIAVLSEAGRGAASLQCHLGYEQPGVADNHLQGWGMCEL